MTDGWARFWAVDLHVHTPASSDAKEADFGLPTDVVATAIAAGLDAIAITDHNTAAWVEQIATAAHDINLTILPGVELSTPQGHLLGIWEVGTSASVIEDLLVKVGIARANFGNTEVVSDKSMSECAKDIEASGGLAIAAHIDKERGIFAQPVKTHVNQLLEDENISAFEYVLAETPATVAAKLRNKPVPALVQSSDAFNATLSRHAASAIGQRRTWIKAAAPDLVGLRYSFDDPDMRVRVEDPTNEGHASIDNVTIAGGFLSGATLALSPDLNCLLGGTGAGKSLVLEAVRFALGQQVDGTLFTSIRDEVDRRLSSALGVGSEVTVDLTTTAGRFRVKRVFGASATEPTVEQDLGGDWVGVSRTPESLLSVAAFSQGEILEYARQPVGRVGLVDAQLDLSDIESRIATAESRLRDNSKRLMTARKKVAELRERADAASALADRVQDLSEHFDADVVKEQGLWASELGLLKTLLEQVADVEFERPFEPEAVASKMAPAHDAQFKSIERARLALTDAIDAAEELVAKAVTKLEKVAAKAQKELEAEYKTFQAKVDATLTKTGSSSLAALRRELEGAQSKLAVAQQAAGDLTANAEPELAAAMKEREDLLEELKRARDDRRGLRRTRAGDLNKRTSGDVKIDIPSNGDTTQYRAALGSIKVGSRVNDSVLDDIAAHIKPFTLVRALWSGDPSTLKLPAGVSATDIARLHANIADRELWEDLLELQLVDTPDVLSVKFRKPGETGYADIKDLSHGQKCTAILVLLLADGETPVLIDQPEDALHAPWIEEYLVDRLRTLRGVRQYIFATRSPGLVVSADSEQLITMRATAGKGEVEATGSLERHDLNKLALHHLEGGKIPFARRTRKLQASIAD